MTTTIETANLISNKRAGADLTGDTNKLVKIDSATDTIVLCVADDQAFGVLRNAPDTGESAIVASFGALTKAISAATLPAGSLCKPDANGELVAATAGDFASFITTKASVAGDVVQGHVVALELDA